MPTELRPYQIKILEEMRTLMRQGNKSILATAPTGAGKTRMVAEMLKNSAERGIYSLFVMHRRELVNQSIQAFHEAGVPHGVIARGYPEDPRHHVQIASIQTLARRIGKIKQPGLIIYDECHHQAAGSWAKLYATYPSAFQIGLTATPERLDGKGLGGFFKSMILGPNVRWLIENQFLCPYKLYAPPTVDISGLKNRMGDFDRSGLSSALDKPSITGNAVREYVKQAAGKRAVVFCVSIAHSKHVVESFNAAGIRAAHVDGETDAFERAQALRDFEAGKIQVLSNVDLFGEGLNIPAVEVAILLRPTQSLGLYLQQVGRVLRPFPGKQVAIILDHAGNCVRHGLPDEEREWTLSGRSKKTSEPSLLVCEKCFAAQERRYPSVCAFCGHLQAVADVRSAGREVEEREGELVEVDPAVLRRQRAAEQGTADSLDDLIALGRARGYKKADLWAKHVWAAREAKKASSQGKR